MKIFLGLIFFGITACSQSAPPSTSRQGSTDYSRCSGNNCEDNSSSDNSTTESSSLDVETEIKKIDPEKLFVVNLRVGTYKEKRIVHELISYEADGRSDYVYYRICPLENTGRACTSDDPEECAAGGDCVVNIFNLDRVILPTMKAGNSLISVRACVDQAKSLDTQETCGPWNEILHNTKRRDAVAEKLLLEKDRILIGLERLEVDFRDALTKFTEEGLICLERDADANAHLEAKIRFADLILKAPVGWMFNSIKMHGNNLVSKVGLESVFGEIGGAITEMSSEISEFIGDQCDKLGEKWCGYAHLVKELGGMALAGFNPVHSIGILSGAIHDLTADRDDLVKRNCNAEAAFQQRQQAIEQYWSNQANRLQSIRADLVAKGYL